MQARTHISTAEDAGAGPPAHLLEYRASTRWLGGRYYIAIFIGSERRAEERIEKEGEYRTFAALLLELLALIWMIAVISLCMIGFTVVGAYLVKSGLGIDLFDGHSVFHALFYD